MNEQVGAPTYPTWSNQEPWLIFVTDYRDGQVKAVCLNSSYRLSKADRYKVSVDGWMERII